jgi:hypothetical protein
MKAFISYSTALDQIIGLRLQTMAAVYGITSYVPSATTRQFDSPLSADVLTHLRESDVVLAIITHNPTSAAVSEMNWALTERKLLVPIVGPGVSPDYYRKFEPSFLVDPADPSQAASNRAISCSEATGEYNQGRPDRSGNA